MSMRRFTTVAAVTLSLDASSVTEITSGIDTLSGAFFAFSAFAFFIFSIARRSLSRVFAERISRVFCFLSFCFVVSLSETLTKLSSFSSYFERSTFPPPRVSTMRTLPVRFVSTEGCCFFLRAPCIPWFCIFIATVRGVEML